MGRFPADGDFGVKRYQVNREICDGITQRLAQCLAGDPRVAFAYLHGSFTGDGESGFADIDVAVFLMPSSEADAMRYELSSEESLQRLFSFPIDLRVLNHAPASFRYSVIKNGRRLVDKDENLRVEFEVSTLRQYFDFSPFRRRYLQEVLGLEV